jgi:hypothetical protein
VCYHANEGDAAEAGRGRVRTHCPNFPTNMIPPRNVVEQGILKSEEVQWVHKPWLITTV